MTQEKIAVITHVKFGLDALNRVSLELIVEVEETHTVSILFNVDKTVKLIEENNISDITELTGKFCWVELKENRPSVFKRFYKYTRV